MPASFKPPEDISYKKLNGDWTVLVDSASEYTIELTARDNLNNGLQVQKDFGTDILVIPTPLGLKIMINSIQFEYNKADLLPGSFDILKRLISKIEKFPNYEVGIAGHTDSTGSDEYNQKLSERRALAVYKYLVEQDVDKERLSTQGFGETQPIDDNETEQGRARNRRVEFYLTKNP
jgi:outer membrane protein OmpA-like peptidoglycan-associated protein